MFFLLKLLNKYKTVVKFVFAGATATATHFFILFALTDIFHLWYIISTTFGYIGGFFVSFTLQKFWTFRDRSRRWRRQMFLYFLVSLTGLGINTAMMYILVDYFGLWYILAQLITVSFIAVGNFIVYRLIIFKKSKSIEKSSDHQTKKIVLAAGIFPPDIGGPATYVKTVAQELAQAGYKVVVITYASLSERDFKEGLVGFRVIKVSRTKNLLSRYFKYFLAVWRQAREADIVYLQDTVSAGVPAALACYLRAKRYILKVVGDYAWEQGRQRFGVRENLDEFQKKKYSWRVEVFRRLQRWVTKQAQLVIVPSQYLKNIVTGWGVADGKVKVIYNAVAPPVNFSRQQVRSDLGLSEDDFVVISVGRLVPWKGFGVLLDLAPALAKEIVGFKLIIVGDGPERKKLKVESEKLKIKDKILFTGQLPQEKLWQYLAAADLFVLNTGYEGLPHIVIEAMFLGLPVVTTRVGGNPEVVQDGENGILVEYNSKEEIKKAILDLYHHPEKRKRLVGAAQASLNKFSQEAMIKNLLRELNNLI